MRSRWFSQRSASGHPEQWGCTGPALPRSSALEVPAPARIPRGPVPKRSGGCGCGRQDDPRSGCANHLGNRELLRRLAQRQIRGRYRDPAHAVVSRFIARQAHHAIPGGADSARRYEGALQRRPGNWARGETRYPRYVPWLTREYEKTAGKEKQRVLRAMSRARQQLRACAGAGDIRMTVVESAILPDKSRRIAVAMWSRNGDLSSLSPSQFAMWENNELVTDYSARCVASPPLLDRKSTCLNSSHLVIS